MITGRDVHRAWRDGMLEQDRRVPGKRMHWATLSDQDRALDEAIAERLNELVAEEVARGEFDHLPLADVIELHPR